MSVISSLTNRIFLASAALVVLAITVAVLRVNASVTAQEQADLRRGLDEAVSLVDEFSRTEFDAYTRDAAFIADLPDLKNAVSTHDPSTVQPIADEYQKQSLRADFFVVTDRNGSVMARAGRLATDDGVVARVLAARPSTHDSTWFWPYAGGVLQVAALPMQPDPAPLGTLIAGFSLDQAMAERIHQFTDSDIVVAAGTRVVASTLPAGRADALGAFVTQPGIFRTEIGGEEYIARVQPLGSATAGPGAPVAIVLRSETRRLQFLSQLHREFAATAVGAVLLATLVGYLVARTVTRPLRAVTATMREMAATGDLARTVPAGGQWDDEDARLLAATFRQLTAALNRFQREAAQRERLSSLGRLSTVIAHEVRNPLMIIKTATHQLRRHPSPEALTDAAASIEEEVTRLNRVVTDVLDFAKPIRFELLPTDLTDLCRSAAHAVEAGMPGVPITVETTSGRAVIVADGERLRAVLVNLLTNAQHAIAALGPGAERTPGPPIQLTATQIGDHRWRLEVADRGVGIAPADLPRLFEPFFTTRRTGSGLGLALSRNIVEGLGGTITVASSLDAGTCVRVDLPDRPSPAEVAQ